MQKGDEESLMEEQVPAISEERALILVRLKTGAWTLPLSPMPQLLENAGVPREMWETTYTQAQEWQTRYSNMLVKLRSMWRQTAVVYLFALVLTIVLMPRDPDDGSFKPWMCFGLPVGTASLFIHVVGYVRKVDPPKELVAWTDYVKEQGTIYRPYGIQVSFAKLKDSRGKVGVNVIVGGITFSRGPSVASSQEATGTSTGVVRDLESLSELHQNGTLTDEEFGLAKARVLHMTTEGKTPESDSVHESVEPQCGTIQSLEIV